MVVDNSYLILSQIAALYVEKSEEARKELLTKIIGSKGKGAILKKAITSNSVYHPNLLENVGFLLQEVIGSVKWRKLVSHFEGGGALDFFQELDKDLGGKRLAEEEVRRSFLLSSFIYFLPKFLISFFHPPFPEFFKFLKGLF